MYFACQILTLSVFLLPASISTWTASDTESLLKKIEAAYEGVRDYQAHLETRTLTEDDAVEIKKALYTFKKPHHIRIDFESPYPGAVLIYPDKNGKVVIRPSGWARFFRFRLTPETFLLEVSPGQRIDQTDLGLLIKNISHSVTDRRRGDLEVTQGEGHIRIGVLADDHFRDGVVTRYQFLIDKRLWLPVAVIESTQDGRLEREIFFRGLRVNVSVPDGLFGTEGD